MDGLRQLALVTTIAMAGMAAAVTAESQHLETPAGLLPDISAKASPKIVLASVRVIALASQPLLPPPMPAQVTAPPAGIAPRPQAIPAPPPTPRPTDPSITKDQGNAVAQRVRDIVPAELIPYFDVYLYVSKSAQGAWAQHLYVFDKSAGGDFVFEQAFPVSTGRELHEKYFTSTPTGVFELDPDRFDRVHFSHRWGGAAMPWAMFLDYTIHGNPTGIALHSAAGHAFELGHRASGGCVRLPPEKAEELFRRFQAYEHGLVPVFAFDDERGTTLTNGSILRDPDGSIAMRDGYKVLLIIEDYPGGPAYVAALS
jgi:lipoprotein-anchoring transpeptidase ErfK/SrfK